MNERPPSAKHPQKAHRIWRASAYAFLAISAAVFAYRSPWKIANLPDAFRPGAGANAVPGIVIEMSDIASRRSLSAFGLSPNLAADPLLSQRATEYLYPIRVRDDPEFVFARRGEVLDRCRLIDAGNAVVLNACER